MRNRISLLLLLLPALCGAALTRIDAVEKSDERLVGKVHFAIDPKLAPNRIIADVDLAPRNAEGLVEFSADLYILKPAKSNGTILFEVVNRGNKGLLARFHLGATPSQDPRTPAHFGDRFLLEQGFTLVWLGWQGDIPKGQGMRMESPVAKGAAGLVRYSFVPDRPMKGTPLAGRGHIPYPVSDETDPRITLTVRERAEGERRTIPRPAWRFVDRTSIAMDSGFERGKIYEILYPSTDPWIAGLGPAGIRDLISYLKFDAPERHLKWAIGFGTSQSGRFLRAFLYDGFNQDEKSRQVFDGLWPHVAGAGRGSFNHRFAQPTQAGNSVHSYFYPVDLFPFSDLEQTDPETGLTDGLLRRAEKAGVTPKIFYTNSSVEYWARVASLTATTLDGKRDVPLGKNTRLYLITGTQHGPAPFPPPHTGTRHLHNPGDYRWAMRALLVAMQAWLKDGTEPPPSQYPQAGKDQLVSLGAVKFPQIPGALFPAEMPAIYRMDLTVQPPKLGKPYPLLVPQVDADGNETSGIRLPHLSVPLATYTGWNFIEPRPGELVPLAGLTGSYIPFAVNREERLAGGDSRLSIEERYRGRQAYLDRVATAARDLARERYMLPQDVTPLVETSARQWDALTARKIAAR